MWAPKFGGGLLGFLLLAEGCHKLLGDYTLDEGQGEGVTCNSGATQCVGNVLQACNSLGTRWDNRAVCASEALCDKQQALCLQPKCAAGERRCLGAELQVCNAMRNDWAPLQTCATAGRCSTASGTCTDQPCNPGTIQCNGAVLQSCRNDQSGWDDVPMGQCGSAALCNQAEGKCDPAKCQPGEFHCEGAALQVCNPMLDGWSPIRSCDSEALCDKNTGACGTVNCTAPGVFRCRDSGVLERCADDLTGWIALNTCQSAAYCDAVKGVCTDVPCQTGAHQCDGETLDVCNAGHWDPVESCQTDGLCQQTLSLGAATCAPPACSAGDTRCSDGQPEICNAGLTGFRANGAVCPTAELCNAGAGTCGTPVCEPNSARCTGAQPEICNPGRTGYVANGSPCASAALCNLSTGTCGDQKCHAGQMRCDPANPTHLQRCKADLTDWELIPCDICDTPELCSASLAATTCDANSCKAPLCNAGEPHCGGSSTDQGKVLEVCNTGRSSYTPCQTCVTKELCDVSLQTKPFACTSASCTAPSCGLTDRWCGGTGSLTLYQCPSSRINWQATALDTCATNGLCELTHQNNKTVCEQPTCALTDQWCGGTGNLTLYQCPSSRINWQATALDTCATNGLCELTDQNNKTVCEQPTCALTERWCGGTGNLTLYQCPSSRIKSQGTALDTCVTNGLCELTRQNAKTTCEAPRCVAGVTQCGGAGSKILQMCKSDRTGFTDCDTCDTAQLCADSTGATTCSASACLACAVGEARCNVSGNYEKCKADRTGFNVTDCMGNGCDMAMGGCLTSGQAGAGG